MCSLYYWTLHRLEGTAQSLNVMKRLINILFYVLSTEVESGWCYLSTPAMARVALTDPLETCWFNKYFM